MTNSDNMLRHLFIISILAFASVRDIKSLEIPDRCFILIMLCAKAFSLHALLCFACVSAAYMLLILISSIAKRNVPIGMGDAKLFAALAFSAGIKNALNIFLLSSLTAGVYAAFLLISRRKNAESVFAYAPFILSGYLINLINIFYLKIC